MFLLLNQTQYLISGLQSPEQFLQSISMQQNGNFHGLSLSPDLERLKRKLIKPTVLDGTSTPKPQQYVPVTRFKTEQSPIYYINEKEDQTERGFNDLQSSQIAAKRSRVELVQNKIKNLLSHERERHIFPPIGNIRRLLKDPKQWKSKESAVLKNYIDENLLNRMALGQRISKIESREQINNKIYEDSISGYLKMHKDKKHVYYRPEQIRKRGSLQEQRSKFSSKDIKRRKNGSSQLRNHRKDIGLTKLLKKNKSQTKIHLENNEQFNFFELRTEFAKNNKITLQQIFTLKEHEEQLMLNNNHRIPRIPQKQQMKAFLENYQPVNEQINIVELAKGNFCSVQYNQKELFVGEMVGKKKSGIGILITRTWCFQGVWKNNQKIRGVQITTEGVYKGGYVNDYREGRGEFQWYSGEMYVGEWKKGVKHGDGLWINPRGDSYNGQWKNDRIEGIGTFTIKNVEETRPDHKYKGSFLNFRKHGFGRENFQNGDFFEGIYKEDYPQGKGVYRWANGSLFQGQFNEGRRHGMGILKTSFKLTYKGEFINDKAEGECEIVLPNGDVYYGMVRDGRKNGKGTLQLKASSQVFNGYWKNDYFVSETE